MPRRPRAGSDRSPRYAPALQGHAMSKRTNGIYRERSSLNNPVGSRRRQLQSETHPLEVRGDDEAGEIQGSVGIVGSACWGSKFTYGSGVLAVAGLILTVLPSLPPSFRPSSLPPFPIPLAA